MIGRQFICPSCRASFPIHVIGGMNSVMTMPCDSCPEVICVHANLLDQFVSWPHRVLGKPPLLFLTPILHILGLMPNPFTKTFHQRVSERYSPCACGGTFRHDAPYHCPHCRSALSRNLLPGAYYITRYVEV